MYLAIDPGITTGYALFKWNGELEDFGQVKGFEGFFQWLEALDPKPGLIICEEWVTNPNIPQGGSRQETSQIIGVVRAYSVRHGICIEWQSPRILNVGYAWAGINKLPKTLHHLSHQYDAMAHGIYYLVRHKIIPTALERKIRQSNQERMRLPE